MKQRHKVIRAALPEVYKVAADVGHGKGAGNSLHWFGQLVCPDSHHTCENHEGKIKSHSDAEGETELFAHGGDGMGDDKQNDSQQVQGNDKAYQREKCGALHIHDCHLKNAENKKGNGQENKFGNDLGRNFAGGVNAEEVDSGRNPSFNFRRVQTAIAKEHGGHGHDKRHGQHDGSGRLPLHPRRHLAPHHSSQQKCHYIGKDDAEKVGHKVAVDISEFIDNQV